MSSILSTYIKYVHFFLYQREKENAWLATVD